MKETGEGEGGERIQTSPSHPGRPPPGQAMCTADHLRLFRECKLEKGNEIFGNRPINEGSLSLVVFLHITLRPNRSIRPRR